MKTQYAKINTASLLLLSALSITACSTRIQITEYPTHQENKVAAFATYCWAESTDKESALEKVDPTGGHHNVFDQSVKETINADLNTKGYQQATCSSADFIVDYRMGLHEDVAAVDAVSENSNINSYGPRWSIGDDKSVTYEGLVEPKENIITVRHGTVHIAAFTTANQILWHSSAEKTLNDQESDETRKENIKKAVHSMMAGFPEKH